MKPKKKSGFRTYISSTLPLASSPKKKKVPEHTEPATELLPNGFYVGERVYYINTFDGRVEGNVCWKANDDNLTLVWCRNWGTQGDRAASYVQASRVRRVNEDAPINSAPTFDEIITSLDTF